MLAADPTVAGDGHPGAPPAGRLRGRDHDPQGAPRQRCGPAFLAARAFQRTSVPAGRDRPGRLVAHREPRSRSARAGRARRSVSSTTLPYSGGPRDRVHPRRGRSADLLAGARSGARPPRRRAREAVSRQRRLGRRVGARPAGPGSIPRSRALFGALRARAGRPATAAADVQGPGRADDRVPRDELPAAAHVRRPRRPPGPARRVGERGRRSPPPPAHRQHRRRRAGPSSGGQLAPAARPAARHRPRTLEARAGKDAFVRVLDVDYSVPPAFVGRRVAVRVSPTTVSPRRARATEIAAHARSFVPADVVLAPGPRPGDAPGARGPRPPRRRRRPSCPPVDLGRVRRACWRCRHERGRSRRARLPVAGAQGAPDQGRLAPGSLAGPATRAGTTRRISPRSSPRRSAPATATAAARG